MTKRAVDVGNEPVSAHVAEFTRKLQDASLPGEERAAVVRDWGLLAERHGARVPSVVIPQAG